MQDSGILEHILMKFDVLSFNIWDLPLFFVKHRRERVLSIAEYLVKQNADVICLQEAFDVEHRVFLAEKLKTHGYYAAYGTHRMRKILFLKVFDATGGLLIFSKFPIRSSHFTSFSRYQNSALGEFLAQKGFLETMLETPRGLLRVVNTHLHEETPWFIDKSIRLRQLRQLFDVMNGGDIPTILTGDLNQPAIANQEEFAELFKSVGFAHPMSAAAPTYRPTNRYVDNWINRTHRPKRYDYILLKGIGDFGLHATHYAPVKLYPPLSDHDPVLLMLEAK